MKAILGSLLCFVLFASQCFALKGGPPYPGGTFATTGTFAGIMTPDPVQSPGTNSIGLFSVVFPQTGLGTGTLIIFQTGQTYTGTIQGLVDPKSAAISALLYATFPFIHIVESVDSSGNVIETPITVIAVASGQLNGRVTTSSRIIGTADVEFSLSVNDPNRSEVIYDVFGFKQA